MYLLAGWRPMRISNKVPLTRGDARLQEVANMRARPAWCLKSASNVWNARNMWAQVISCRPAMKRCFFCRQISTLRYLLSSGPRCSGSAKPQVALPLVAFWD